MASLQILRDVATGERAGLLDRLILLIAPIYNCDGNEKFARTNRPGR